MNDVRARRRVRSVTDLRTEAASISAASVRDDDAVADRDHDGRVRRARGRASRTGSSCPRRSAARAARTSRPPLYGVEVARRLVTHNQPRVGRERARDRDALLLAARELGREMVELVSQPDQLEVVARPREALPLRAAAREVERQDRVSSAESVGSSWKNWKMIPTLAPARPRAPPRPAGRCAVRRRRPSRPSAGRCP